jgi:hypothetical protein
MVNVKIQRFSRDKTINNEPKNDEQIDESISEPIDEPIKNTRGRPKKQPILIEPENIEEDDPFETYSENSTSQLDNEFLQDFDNEHYQEPDDIIEKKTPKPKQTKNKKVTMEQPEQSHEPITEMESMMKDLLNNSKKQTKKLVNKERRIEKALEDEGGLFSENQATPLLGREKRELISKLNQYKSLFPKELSKFKIKKNPTTSELRAYLDEAEAIVDTSTVEQFVTDSIIQCMKLVEGVSAHTKYNIKGCADMLNTNPQFHQLSKLLYIKYKVFSQIPPEMQMIILVATTAYMAKCKNDQVSKVEDFLNEKIDD